MPGVRWDYSSHYGGFFTPRLHVKYVPVTGLTLRASAGKGYRSPHALAEQMPMLASGRT
ncbi:MAG: TonB-dependent receptor, partial [Parabacteroides sp.]|nr:TonB-dependent receptor [Parabacteroides sp.]